MRIDMTPHIGADFANFVKAIACRDTGAGDLKRAVLVESIEDCEALQPCPLLGVAVETESTSRSCKGKVSN